MSLERAEGNFTVREEHVKRSGNWKRNWHLCSLPFGAQTERIGSVLSAFKMSIVIPRNSAVTFVSCFYSLLYQDWKINRTVFVDKDRTMDNVQKHNICDIKFVKFEFEVFLALDIKIYGFFYVTPWILVDTPRFVGIWYLHFMAEGRLQDGCDRFLWSVVVSLPDCTGAHCRRQHLPYGICTKRKVVPVLY
jgi:hypothetical protein